MSWVEDKLTEQFYRWELRGRGWQVCEYPVSIEPAFRPFVGHFVPPVPERDEGRRHSFLSRAFEQVGKAFSTTEPSDDVPVGEDEEEPEPELWEREELVESQIVLSRERRYPREVFESFLLSLASCEESVAFEVLGTHQETVIQFASSPRDASLLQRQVRGRFAGVATNPTESALIDAWSQAGASCAIAEFGLEHEFVLGLDTGGAWQPGLFAALSELDEGELGLLQIIFQPTRHSWAESSLLAVTDGEGGSFFSNRPELVKEAAQKFRSPLFAVVLRFSASADDPDRAWRIIAEMASGFASLSRPAGNSFVPLANSDYDAQDHEEDLIRRQSRRAGMLLNLSELACLVRFPDASIHAPMLRQDLGKSRAAPLLSAELGGVMLGENVHAGVAQPVCLSLEQRLRHVHCIGASGTGKTTFLAECIRQDLEGGQGFAVLDPHGDLIDHILGIIPAERISDVVLFDPADEDYSVGFNILSAHSDWEKRLLASDLVSVFHRLSTSWGDQMASVLNNAILAFLESTEGGTLADLRRFLLDAVWRKQFLRTVKDAEIVFYWEKGFPQLGGNKSIGPVLTRLDAFLAPKTIRYMVSQRENRVNFAEITDSGKILLAKLSQGQIGRENAWLLGSLLVSKLQQTAMARQRLPMEKRRPFWLYVDEFHNFITPSMAEILSGARKYRLGLTLAHQDLGQLKREQDVANAVLSNAATRVVFRVSDQDANALKSGFAHFDAEQLQSLETGEAICRIERADVDFNLSVPYAEAVDEALAAGRRRAVIDASRLAHARPRAEIEAEIQERVAPIAEVDAVTAPAKRQLEPPQESPPAEIPSDVRSQLAAIREQLQKVTQPPPPAEESVAAIPKVAADSSVPAPTQAEPQPVAYEPTQVRMDVEQLGRGGELHKAAQLELQQIARSLNFQAVIEWQLPSSLSTVDLYLQRGAVQLGCEISVTNTLDYELRNVAKILGAGIPMVAVIALDEAKLSKLEAAIRNSLPAEQSAKVRCYLKPQFVSFLQSLVTEPLPVEAEGVKRVKGWKVKRTTVSLSPDEVRQREKELAETMAGAVRRAKSGKSKK